VRVRKVEALTLGGCVHARDGVAVDSRDPSPLEVAFTGMALAGFFTSL
jgi:hypothetical protein